MAPFLLGEVYFHLPINLTGNYRNSYGNDQVNQFVQGFKKYSNTSFILKTAFKNNQRPIDTFVNSAIYTRRSTSCVRKRQSKRMKLKFTRRCISLVR